MSETYEGMHFVPAKIALELAKDRDEFAQDRLNWKRLANEKGEEVRRLREALRIAEIKLNGGSGDGN